MPSAPHTKSLLLAGSTHTVVLSVSRVLGCISVPYQDAASYQLGSVALFIRWAQVRRYFGCSVFQRWQVDFWQASPFSVRISFTDQ